VDVWQLDLDAADAAEGTAGGEVLSDDERARSLRFYRPDDARRWSSTRVALRWILAAYLERDPHELRFTLTAKDKPVLEGQDGRQLFFNVSHSQSVGLVAVSRTFEVGVDVEEMGVQVDHLSVAERVFAPAIVAELRDASAERRAELFFREWVRLEASAKCLGLGLSSAPLPPAPGLWVEDLRIGARYAAALAVRERGLRWDQARLRRFSWDDSLRELDGR
jgi:4'-phosphopantetheinyl transferase